MLDWGPGIRPTRPKPIWTSKPYTGGKRLRHVGCDVVMTWRTRHHLTWQLDGVAAAWNVTWLPRAKPNQTRSGLSRGLGRVESASTPIQGSGQLVDSFD
ncbi:hypothetical protein LIER_24841 [Lithospermum erythrorhizon]|uniref:Uncharacterized protein n=1 Tax=Lithospermum erythrorhizon TaxID=34254 RepID=A0AAV3R2G2_LITER